MTGYKIIRMKQVSNLHSLRASSPGRSGVGAGQGRRACNYVSGIWIPPSTPLWLPVDWAVKFPPSLMSSKPISISHRLFRWRHSNSRDVVRASNYNTFFALIGSLHYNNTRRQFKCLSANLRACLHGGGGPRVGEVTLLGRVTRLFI